MSYRDDETIARLEDYYYNPDNVRTIEDDFIDVVKSTYYSDLAICEALEVIQNVVDKVKNDRLLGNIIRQFVDDEISLEELEEVL